MCTVTYIPTGKNGFILTANRDEKTVRPTTPPVFRLMGKSTVWFPQDLLAGGTWIALSDNGKACCLMNGGFEKHIPKEHYAKSRGKILLEVFNYEETDQFIEAVFLQDTQPFSLVIAETKPGQGNRLIRFTWDGINRHVNELDPGEAYLWSSVTLYEHEIRKLRQTLFEEWIRAHPAPSAAEVQAFHSEWHGSGDRRNMIFSKTGDLQTVSITQVKLSNTLSEMQYIDLKSNTIFEKSIAKHDAICVQ
jgi:hypothetical protein